MKNILISSFDMEVGGVERSLISMLDNFDYEKYNVKSKHLSKNSLLVKDSRCYDSEYNTYRYHYSNSRGIERGYEYKERKHENYRDNGKLCIF